MASQEPSVQFVENPEHEEIPKEESIFNFNFDSPQQGSLEDEQAIEKIIQDEKIIKEASQSAHEAVQDEKKEEEEENGKEVEVEQAELNRAVFIQAKLEEEIVEVLSERKSLAQLPAQPPAQRPAQLPITSKRIKHASERFAASLQQQQEEARLREEAKQEAQRRLEAKESKKSELLEVIDTENVTYSQLKNESGVSETDTSIAHRFITVGRLETYKPSSQAGVIFGDPFMRSINGETPCALCGFKLKDRISYWHNVYHEKTDPETTLTWSFDHRPPINFSAIMFRIVVATGTYTQEELNYLRVTGDIVCFHCNYEKSQRLFITCPVGQDKDKTKFSGFSPNVPTITKFVNDLFDSKHRYGYSQMVGERTLQNCLKAARKSKKDWITERINHIKGLAQQVCNMIRDNVDRVNVQVRYKLTKIIVRQGKRKALKDTRYPKDLRPDQQTRFIREYIAKLFSAAELSLFPRPWIGSPRYVPAPYIPPDSARSIRSSIPGFMAPTLSSIERNKDTGPKKQSVKKSNKASSIVRKTFSANAGSRRKLKKKSKRKTYRRKRLF
jgi:hypothetical protein